MAVSVGSLSDNALIAFNTRRINMRGAIGNSELLENHIALMTAFLAA